MTLNEYTVEEINNVYKIVKEKRFLILKGATGTGKTLYAHALACLLVDCSMEDLFGKKLPYHGGDREVYDSVYHNVQIHEKYNKYLGNGQVRNVIFHKATNRENFVYGISVSTKEKQLQFESRKRVFLEAVEAAKGDKDHAYVIILDDIGRADFSAVMGDLLSALESMGDGNTFQADKKHEIPQNLYIIATYNPAVAASTVDYAWYRRFFVYELNPDERYIIKSKDTIWKNNSIFALYGENGEMRTDYKGFSNFRTMDDYQRFMDYVYVLFMHVKILFEKYSTDPDVRNLYIPGHGMFLTYVKGKNFKENIDTFHFQLRHVIVPLLYHCLHTGLLDQRAAFDIDLLEHLWEEGYGEIEHKKEAAENTKRWYEDRLINKLIDTFPFSVIYFFILRNPLLMRTAHDNVNRYFLFEKEKEIYRAAVNFHITSQMGVKVHNNPDNKYDISMHPYMTLDDNYKKEEDYCDTNTASSGQVYPGQVFLFLFKATVKLLAIDQEKEINEIWRELDGDQNRLQDIIKEYKKHEGPRGDSGRYGIKKLYEAFKLRFPELDNAQPN